MPGTSVPLAQAHQHWPHESQHCSALKLPSASQAGVKPPMSPIALSLSALAFCAKHSDASSGKKTTTITLMMKTEAVAGVASNAIRIIRRRRRRRLHDVTSVSIPFDVISGDITTSSLGVSFIMRSGVFVIFKL